MKIVIWVSAPPHHHSFPFPPLVFLSSHSAFSATTKPHTPCHVSYRILQKVQQECKYNLTSLNAKYLNVFIYTTLRCIIDLWYLHNQPHSEFLLLTKFWLLNALYCCIGSMYWSDDEYHRQHLCWWDPTTSERHCQYFLSVIQVRPVDLPTHSKQTALKWL